MKPLAQHIHKTPSVGSVIKKLMNAHPELSAADMTAVVRQAIVRQGDEAGDFAGIEVIDEALALRLAGEPAPSTIESRREWRQLTACLMIATVFGAALLQAPQGAGM